MAVIDENEIELNSIKYPIQGKVRPILSAKFAQKMVIGDFTKASNPEVDSWVIQDQRGGILAEEMDEARQANRAWWSTCNLGFLGHITLPRLATEIAFPATATEPTYTPLNPSFEDWTGDNPNNWTPDTPSRVTEDAITVRTGESSCKIFTEASEEENYIKQSFTSPTEWIGYALTLTVYAQEDEAGYAQLILYRNGASVGSDSTSGTGDWELLSVGYTVPAGTTSLEIRLLGHSGGGISHKEFFFDDVALSYTAPVAKTYPTAWANFDGNLYVAFGKFLYKLDDAGTGWTVVAPLPEGIDVYGYTYAITDLIASVANKLYIFFGDTGTYKYMDATTQTVHDTDVADATYGITWDSKLFKINSAGSMSYDTMPNEANPSWVDDGDLADEGLADGDVQSLFIYRDAAGNPIIYAGTKLGLYAHSFGNDKWVATELAMPQHATAGKGVVHWRDKCYVSAGLDVLAYQTGGAGTAIASMGLSTDDGLPELRGGEIVTFIKGYNEFFALVDSTYEGTGSRSTVMAYDGKGWQCWWKAGSDNLHMYTGIVSTKKAHRLWFTCGTKVYWIALQKNIRNPKKVSTFPYDTAGVHITPWFDANWVGTKLALQFKVFCKDVTANETVLVEYRIDHIETDLTTGWDNLGTIVAAGNEVETTYTFGSNLGTNFKAIQFRFSLGRDNGGGNPEYDSPDVQYAVLEYQKVIKPTWNWGFTVDCTKDYAGRTANQMLDAIVTAAELELLTPFLYKDTTYYVRIKSVEGERLSGDGRKGTYNILVSKPV